MRLRTLTQIVVVMIVFFLILWDLYAAWLCGSPCTISRTVLAWEQQFPAVLLAVGALLGHLFFPQHPDCDSCEKKAQ